MADINKQFKVHAEDGTEITFNLLFTYDEEETNNVYVFVYVDDEDEIIPFLYDEENESLLPIEDDETFEKLDKVLEDYCNEEN